MTKRKTVAEPRAETVQTKQHTTHKQQAQSVVPVNSAQPLDSCQRLSHAGQVAEEEAAEGEDKPQAKSNEVQQQTTRADVPPKPRDSTAQHQNTLEHNDDESAGKDDSMTKRKTIAEPRAETVQTKQHTTHKQQAQSVVPVNSAQPLDSCQRIGHAGQVAEEEAAEGEDKPQAKSNEVQQQTTRADVPPKPRDSTAQHQNTLEHNDDESAGKDDSMTKRKTIAEPRAEKVQTKQHTTHKQQAQSVVPVNSAQPLDSCQRIGHAGQVAEEEAAEGEDKPQANSNEVQQQTTRADVPPKPRDSTAQHQNTLEHNDDESAGADTCLKDTKTRVSPTGDESRTYPKTIIDSQAPLDPAGPHRPNSEEQELPDHLTVENVSDSDSEDKSTTSTQAMTQTSSALPGISPSHLPNNTHQQELPIYLTIENTSDSDSDLDSEFQERPEHTSADSNHLSLESIVCNILYVCVCFIVLCFLMKLCFCEFFQ
ncbi:enolase-phosphatase E1-like [Littorina saxatilis]|uniref:enolase-phosphatase E1-like n=1 Tax=Littorina saxatilis TaxID=31220 RepID=UPI0038B65AC6